MGTSGSVGVTARESRVLPGTGLRRSRSSHVYFRSAEPLRGKRALARHFYACPSFSQFFRGRPAAKFFYIAQLEILYDKYVKVAIDKKKIERVANMDLYQLKSKVKYLSEEDVDFLWEEFKEERGEDIAENMLKKNKYSVEEISEITELTIEKITALKDRLDATKK